MALLTLFFLTILTYKRTECEGPALTGEEETEEDKGKEPEAEGSEKQEESAAEHPVIP